MSDVTIIGAGPAGSAAAIILARAGWHVTLIEQHRFPRDKVCGECLSAVGIDVLRRLELHESVRKLEPVELTRTAMSSPDGRCTTVDLPRPMWGVSRAALDDLLLREADRAGATVLQPARCESVDVNGEATTIVRDLCDNTRRVVRSTCILVADGKAALCSPRPTPTTDLGIKAHFAGVQGPRDTIGLFGVVGHYVGLAPIEGGRWNIAFSVPAARVQEFGGELDELFAQVTRENAALAREMRRAGRIGRWLASPLPRFPVARRWPDRIIPIGNAAAALEPIGGEGIGLAMHSAELAAAALITARRGGRAFDAAGLRSQYDALWRVRRAACRATAIAVSSPPLATMMTRLAAVAPPLTRLVLGAVGKSALA